MFLICALAAPSGAQRTAADSLAERLRQAEAAIAALQTQVAEQAQSGARSRSGARLEFTGRVMVKAFGNNRRVNNVDNPQFVLIDPDPASGVPSRGVGMAIRESRIGLRVDVPEALGGAFVGDIDADFYGGQAPSSGGRTFPLARIRTARAIVRWTNAELLVGQESPLVSGLNPQTLSAVGTPAFATAGNLWLWLPQVRVGVRTGGSAVRFGLQGAVLAPTSGDAAALFDTDYDLAERTSRPFLQVRASARWGEAEMTRDVGCGVHQGWLMAGANRIDSRAVACDALLPITERLELRGEYFMGEALRGLGGGGIGQNFTTANSGLETSGGWAQLNARLGVSQTGIGCGVDHPDAQAARRRNDSCAAYFTVRPTGPLFFGVELRRIRTAYASSRYVNDNVTLASGFEF